MIIDPANFQFTSPTGFLVLEGLNGAGKTTLQAGIADLLTRRQHEVIRTREPGATSLGRELRSLILEQSSGKVSVLAELFLFAADRAEHVSKLIRPALEARKCVLSDRYFYSTLAFQGYGRGIDRQLIEQIMGIAIDGTHPDLVLLLDLDPLRGLERSRDRENSANAGGKDAFELEELEFHHRIRKGFLEIAQNSAQPFMVINAEDSPARILEVVEPVISRWSEALCSR